MANIIYRFLGSHAGSKEYYENDCVLYASDTWRAKQTTSTTPSAGDNWELYYEGGYKFVRPNNVTEADILVVAGAGGGGAANFTDPVRQGGGGGAGGFVLEEAYDISTSADYTIAVGGGGAGGPSAATAGASGEQSAFGTLTATGGGGGGSAAHVDGKNGGSGGGGHRQGSTSYGTGGTGVSGQGHNGADGSSSGAGGGGGADSAGSSATGGNGKQTNISGAQVTYAVGGDGGSSSTNTNGESGAANTGNGGGGGAAIGTGGDGGSGIVIVSYTPTVKQSQSDDSGQALTESHTVTQSQEKSGADSFGLSLAETLNPITVTAEDSSGLSITESLSIEASTEAADGLAFSLDESVSIIIPNDESVALGLTESHEVLFKNNRPDAFGIAVTESSSVHAVNVFEMSWLFEIGVNKWSTGSVDYGGNTYEARIRPDAFHGVNMRRDVGGHLLAPSDIEFEIGNEDDTINIAGLEGQFCVIRLVMNGSQVRAWKYRVTRTVGYYGKIRCYCEDILQHYTQGDYPNTPSPKEVWPSDDTDRDDDYRIPVTLGRAYVPVRSVNTATERYYVLGASGPTYTVFEVSSPQAWPNQSTWVSASYSFNGSVSSGWQLLQPIIADSTGNGNADAPGLWRSGNQFYDMPCRYERSDTATILNPADWVDYLLKDFGVATGDIDNATFTAVGTLMDAYTIGFDGGWWSAESRERVLVNVLSQFDGYLSFSEQLELYQFSKTPVETFDNVLEDSFRPERITKSLNDSGRVHWPQAYDKPQDVLNGKAVVPSRSGGTTNTPAQTVLQARFLAGQSINAQKAGILFFQKRLEQVSRISFAVFLGDVATKATIRPGQVVVVDNPLYGGSHTIIISDLQFTKDFTLRISGIELGTIEDWADLTTTTQDVVTDTSVGFNIGDTDYGGEVTPVSWSYLLNIPQRFKDTAAVGINVTDSYLGYYDGSVFQSYIDNNGQFQFRGDANNYINWTTGGVLNVVGLINAWNKSGDLTKIDGGAISTNTVTTHQIAAATIVSDNIATNTITANRMNITTLSSITADIGTVTAGTIRDSDSNLVINLSDAEIEVNHDDGLKVYAEGGIFLAPSTTSDTYGKIGSFGAYGVGILGDPHVRIRAENQMWLYSAGAGGALNGVGIQIQTTGAGQNDPDDIVFEGWEVRPGTSNLSLGTSSYRWDTIYCTTLNESSGEARKTELAACDLGVDFVKGLTPKKGKRKESKDNRTQYWFVAEDVESLAAKNDIDFGGLSKEKVFDVDTASGHGVMVFSELRYKPEYGEIIGERYEYGLQYSQFVPILTSAMQEIIERVEQLEAIKNGSKD